MQSITGIHYSYKRSDLTGIRNSVVDFLVLTKDAREDGNEVRVQNHDGSFPDGNSIRRAKVAVCANQKRTF